MTREQTFFARIMLQNKILTSDGYAFEALFTKIMAYANPNFQQVKPQGAIGDRKNDGFDQTTGTYYQVYAPEDASKKENEAIKKLHIDFDGLYKYWEKICPIRRFFFVLNDKFKGAYPSLYDELAKIHQNHPHIETNVFLAKDLENKCFELSDGEIDACIGFIPDIDCGTINYSVLGDVITHLLHVEVNPTKEFIPINPDFDAKIRFNRLSDTIASYLRSHRINEYAVTDYFSMQSAYKKEALRNVFNNLYHEAVETIDDAPDKSDQIFMYIFKHSFDTHRGDVDHAILTLMAYYFEYCDIFQAPEP